ncbi:MAG: hypothetical protein JW873_06660, partial [Candidatus Saganbacteria bacterium]|nr:hypothetical protein [Candidatus Saganbacteria bacterium]
AVCHDLFGLPEFPIPAAPRKTGARVAKLPGSIFSNIAETLARHGFSGLVSNRSSHPAEDRPGQTFAGVFATTFMNRQLINFPAQRIVDVLQSPYSVGAENAFRRRGHSTIPPISVLIQDAVGKEWAEAPGRFFPLASGIVNTSSPGKVKVVSVPGFGLAAVEDEGYGLVHVFDHDLKLIKTEGEVPPHYYYLDQEGEMRKDRVPDFLRRIFSREPVDFRRKLAALALRLGGRMGQPAIDLEYAREGAENATPVLLQCRPAPPKQTMLKPVVKEKRIIFRPKFVLGQKKASYSTVVFGDWGVLWPDLQTYGPFLRKYPDALFVLSLGLPAGEPGDEPARRNFFRGLELLSSSVIIDKVASHRVSAADPGSGVQHLGLRAIEEGRVCLFGYNYCEKLYNPFADLERYLEEKGREIDSSRDHGFHVYALDDPLQLFADDEKRTGMIYLEKDWRPPMTFTI